MVPDLAVRFELNGQQKTLKFREVSFSGWSDLKTSLGFTPRTLMSAIHGLDVEALAALIWLERRTREPRLSFDDVTRQLDDKMPEFALVDIGKDGEWLLKGGEVEEDPTTSGTS